MHHSWIRDLVFLNPDTGITTVIRDAGGAIMFLSSFQCLQQTTEFMKALEACDAALAEQVPYESARDFVRDALRSAGINVS